MATENAVPSGQTTSAVADAWLPRREARALVDFASRDLRVWRNLALTWLVIVAALGLALLISRPTNSVANQQIALLASGVIAVMAVPTTWVTWYLSTLRKVRQAIARQCPPGTVIGTRITADTATFAVGEAAYSFTYEMLTHLVLVDDVLVVKPRDHVVFAVPVEAIDPADLSHLRSSVVNEPMSRATTS